MSLSESLIRRLDSLHSRMQFFLASIALMGTLLVGSALIAWEGSGEQHKLAAAYTQSLRVLGTASDVKLSALNALRGERGYLLTGDPDYLEPYFRGKRGLATSLDRLDRETRGDRKSRAAVRGLRAAIAAYQAQLETIVAATQEGRRSDAIVMVRHNQAQRSIRLIEHFVDDILGRERARLHTISAHVDAVTANMLHFVYLMSFAGLCLLGTAVLTGLALRRSFERERSYREELRQRAETDELTGIANRRELLASLNRAIATARLNQAPLSFALIDIDNFKRVNDTYGHAVGDEVIRHIVRSALSTVRGYDTIGRLGGEEFGIVLPRTSELNAAAVCERLCEQIRSRDILLNAGLEISVTISSGVASLGADDDAASLIERADRALYAAKRSGRDQVKLAA